MIEEGILNIYKEQDWTSHDVIAKLKRVVGNKKCGHTGTLDPMATGVLPVCIGKSTRVIEYLDLDKKSYICTLNFGKRTDTADIWGEPVDVSSEEAVNGLTEESVRTAFASFDGEIVQTPPKYSAIRVNGKRLYEYAREGKKVEIPTRKVFIEKLEIHEIDLGKGFESAVRFSLTCSKGTYIRSICEDVGEALGVHACMSYLERVSTGIFDKGKAFKVSEIAEMSEDEIRKILWPTDSVLINLGKAELNEFNSSKFITGIKLSKNRYNLVKKPENKVYGSTYAVYGTLGGQKKFLGIGILNEEDGKLKPSKIFTQA